MALEVDEDTRARLAAAADALRPQLRGVRLGAPGTFHLTLRFLGASSAAALASVEAALRTAAGSCPAADVPVTGLGLFPEHGPPRVLWAGLDLPAPMRALQSACEQDARAAGFAPETRAFRPHVTLGRWRDRAPRPRLPDVALGEARLERVVLFRSDLRPTGAVHTELAGFALRPAIHSRP